MSGWVAFGEIEGQKRQFAMADGIPIFTSMRQLDGIILALGCCER